MYNILACETKRKKKNRIRLIMLYWMLHFREKESPSCHPGLCLKKQQNKMEELREKKELSQ